jgi:hypothetical protein
MEGSARAVFQIFHSQFCVHEFTILGMILAILTTLYDPLTVQVAHDLINHYL